MWINKKLNDKQLYIHPSQDREDLQKNFLNPIFKWAAVNQGGAVNVWFDSKLTPAQAVENTQALIEEYIQEHPGMAPIQLRDVRTLPKVVQHPEVFSEKTPVYFRVDLIRVIAGLHTISTKETPYFVYADLDVEPLSQEQLFDDQTQQNLKKYGIVIAKGQENGFQIIGHQNAHLLEAMGWVLVELNIARAQRALQGGYFEGIGNKDPRGPTNPLVQSVYSCYGMMFDYFCHLEGCRKLWVDSEVYDKSKHGLRPFGLRCHYTPRLRTTGAFANGPLEDRLGSAMIPAKNVNIPLAGGHYSVATEDFLEYAEKNYWDYGSSAELPDLHFYRRTA